MSSRRRSRRRRANGARSLHNRAHQRRRLAHPTGRFVGVAAGMAAALTAGVWWLLRLDGLLCWLVAINITTGIIFLYDKAIAASGRVRVPERVLLALALVGGSPVALASMQAFRHKTAKRGFQHRFWLVVAVQIFAIAGYYLALTPQIARIT